MSVASCPPLRIEILNHVEEVSNALHKGWSSSKYNMGGSAQKSNPLPFYTPFLAEKVPLLQAFYWQIVPLSKTWLFYASLKSQLTRTFPWLLHSHKTRLSAFFGTFYIQKWQISLPFHIPLLVKSLTFDMPEAWKRYPSWAEPPCINQYTGGVPPGR